MPKSTIKPLRITIVVAALPPILDGIGDYTARLSAALDADDRIADVTVLTDMTNRIDPISGVIIHGDFNATRPSTNWAILDRVATDRPDWLVIQYNPFSYGRRGLNLILPRVLAQIRHRSPGTRVAVMFHETYVPLNRWQFAIMTTWQRYQFWRLGQVADMLFFSISKWTERHRRWFPRKPICHLPVGSAMPNECIDRQVARRRLGIGPDEVVLGFFGSAHVSRDLRGTRQAIALLAANKRRVVFLYIGPHGSQIMKALGAVPAGTRLITDGPHLPHEVSFRLAAVDIFLASYTDGISTRRSAMMAALQHGLAVVGTLGINTDPELVEANGQALVLTPAEDDAELAAAVTRLAADPVERQRIGVNGLILYEQRYSWPAIAKLMISKLIALDSNPN